MVNLFQKKKKKVKHFDNLSTWPIVIGRFNVKQSHILHSTSCDWSVWLDATTWKQAIKSNRASNLLYSLQLQLHFDTFFFPSYPPDLHPSKLVLRQKKEQKIPSKLITRTQTRTDEHVTSYSPNMGCYVPRDLSYVVRGFCFSRRFLFVS